MTSDTFDALLREKPLVLVDFWASWCGPCRAFAPTFEAVSEAHSSVLFGKVDVDAEPELAARFSISSIPTLAVFHRGTLVTQQAGALPPAQLEDLIRRVKTLTV